MSYISNVTSVTLFFLSLHYMPGNFKKILCHPVDFKSQEPQRESANITGTLDYREILRDYVEKREIREACLRALERKMF